ncbi:hypothetical protein SAMN05443665_102988 [Actinomadura meyerae]|uniref:Uncharacterized protein n=1 Tax=Actinomadura meyerae TaxID=240840 RepID=A0A239MM52_9ACTN|nr:hypothetical protein [Actinomadura meyerae]SNT43560.1 hypothetical protein SAMN05443665_102988 [Actinomadura meyerae]
MGEELERPAPTQQVWARRDAFVAARDIYVTAVLGSSSQPSHALGSAFRRERPLFVQYTNPEILACYGIDVGERHAALTLTQALDATRLTLLLTERHLLIPASYIFEIPWYPIFLGCVEPLVRAGALRYVAPVSDLADYREMKVDEYRRDPHNPYRHTGLRGICADPDFLWAPRHGGGTAAGIGELWRTALRPGGELHRVARGTARRWHRPRGRAERLLARTPERLEGQAFIARFVEPTLPVPLSPAESTSLAFFLSRAYLRSYLLDLDAAVLADLPAGDLTCGLSRRSADMNGRLPSARRLDTVLHWLGIADFVHRGAGWDQLLRLRSLPAFGLVIDRAYDEASLDMLRFAVLAVRGSRGFRLARTYAEAKSNVQAVAGAMADFTLNGRTTWRDDR